MKRPEHFEKAKANPRQFATDSTKGQILEVLKYLDHAYHERNKKFLTDNKYDIIKDIFAERFPKSSYLKKVGSAVKGKKEQLPHYMSSLDKVKPGPKIEAWLHLTKGGGPYVTSDKLDGISLQLVYEKGKLTRAYTRGNGKIGKNVSNIIPGLNVPKTVSVDYLAVRAEGIIKHKLFTKKYSKERGGEFVDSRNMVGGLFNSKTPEKELQDVQIIAHSILGGSKAGQPLSQQYKLLAKLGFDVVTHKTYPTLTEQKLIQIFEERKKKSHNLLDGIVVAQDKAYREITDGHPSHIKAFKINSEEDMKEVVVQEVEWQISRHNKLVPVIRIKPTTLGRVTVTYFHGFNAYFIMNGIRLKDRSKGFKKLPIGPGSKLRVIRSGDVIPFIDTVLTASTSGKPQMPSVSYELRGDNNSEAYAVMDTDDQLVKQITYFFSTIGCEGMKSQTVSKLIAAGHDSIQKILKLNIEDFEVLPGFADRSASQLHTNLRQSLASLTFAKLGAASGVFGEGVSAKTLDKIYETYPDVMGLVKLSQQELTSKIEQIHGIKEKARDIARALPKFVRFVQVNKLTIQAPTKIKQIGSAMAGKVVLFTGVRDKELATEIERQGGKVSGTFSKDVNLLVVKDLSFTSSKVEKAKSKGINIADVNNLRRKLGL